MIKLARRRLNRLITHLKYDGNERKCPVCNNGSKQFLEYGIIPRKDAICPYCHSLERHRLFWLFLEKRTNFLSSPPQKALHIAPEAILEIKLRALIGNGYITADLFARNVDMRMDITDIQFPENTFDFIYCSHVLEHVPDDRKAMREFRRVLTPNGIAMLLVPIMAEKTIEDPSIEDPKERLRLFGQEDHVRSYGPDYSSRLKEAGFFIDEVYPEDFLTPLEIEKMGITPASGALYICRK